MAKADNNLPPEAANAVLLHDAFFAFCDSATVERYRRAKIRKKDYEASIDHEDLRRMGRVFTYDPRFKNEIEKQLRALKQEFIQKLKDGALTGWAREGSPLAPLREIPVSAWAMLGLKSLPKNLVQGPNGDLYDVRIGPRAETPAPESAKTATVDVAPHVKGRGGRPSHKNTILKEYERRKKEGLCEDTPRSESFYLESWFKKNFPSEKTPDNKTIYRHISGFEKENDKENMAIKA